MKTSLLLFSLLIVVASAYNRDAAVKYAYQYVHSANHICSTGAWGCSPYPYLGSERCGYPGEGGDCANFVSQCLIAGGHSSLNKGQCRGICGSVEPGAKRLADCLSDNFGWKATCGYRSPPPSYIQPGDVLVYFADSSCSSYDAHAVLVTQVNGGSVKISCHSNEQKDVDYNYMSNSKSYFRWIHHP